MRSKISLPRKYERGYLSLSHRNQINKDKSFILKAMIQLPITLEQLITTVQHLQPSDRAEVAKALIQTELKLDLTALLEELYSQPSIDEITDCEIMNEIKAVRQRINS
jgi:hypothetical protein